MTTIPSIRPPRSPSANPRRSAGGGLVATGMMLATAAVGWQVLATDDTAEPPPRPAPIERDVQTDSGPGIEWNVTEPAIDLGELADVHATSRLQYDECQQDYAEVAADPSSSRNPLYFC